MRYYGPDRWYDGMAPAFIAVNAGKKSIALDLKDSGDAATARSIVERCDVLVENFRPGVMARLGFGFDAVKELKLGHRVLLGVRLRTIRSAARLAGDRQHRAGDQRNDEPRGEPGDPPSRVGFPAVDTLTGQTAAFAILAALLRRAHGDRDAQFIDVAMFDASLAFMASAVVPFLVTGKALQRTGQVGYSGQPTRRACSAQRTAITCRSASCSSTSSSVSPRCSIVRTGSPIPASRVRRHDSIIPPRWWPSSTRCSRRARQATGKRC